MSRVSAPFPETSARGLAADCSAPAPYVLVVDDETMIADTLADILRRAGYGVAVRYDGFSACELVGLAPPDFIITDVCMPGMDGVELALQVRKSTPDCVIFLFSAYADYRNLVTRARTDGHEFTMLGKPMCPERLLEELAAARH